MENNKLIKDIFCAREQKITPHLGRVDGNGEFVFTCQGEGCDRFVKFPATTTEEDFNKLLALHEENNTGQLSVAVQEAKLKALLGVSDEVKSENESPTPPQA